MTLVGSHAVLKFLSLNSTHPHHVIIIQVLTRIQLCMKHVQ